ncbi:MAG: hypothetical protein ABSH45_05660 [Bryobacteraceae bacterium]
MRCVWATFAVTGFALTGAMAQIPAPDLEADNEPVISAPSVEPAPVAVPLNYQQRIAGVIPDYQTVRESLPNVLPLTAAQKWELGWRETVDPFNIATTFMTAAFSQAGNQTPKYGEGWPAYGMRVGAAIGDNATQSVFSAGLVAWALHQDPRYFRYGPGHRIASRVGYSISRLLVCRQDSGKSAFNASNIFGMLMGIAASNAYYPAASRSGNVMLGRIGTSMTGGVTGNLMSEFWPDIQRLLPAMQRKLLGRKKDEIQ